MNVWLIHIGELLPTDGPVRLFRYGILGEMLAQRGHSVTRWAPTFVHATKRRRCTGDKVIVRGDHDRIELLEAGSYWRHVGWQRWRFNQRFARAFARRARRVPPPDVIVAALPAPEACAAAVAYAKPLGLPVVIDVRDLWPDIFLDVAPARLRWAARIALDSLFRRNRRIFRAAASVVAVSRSYLRWGLEQAGRAPRPTDGVFPLGYQPRSLGAEERRAAVAFWRGRGIAQQRSFRCCYFGAMNETCDLETVLDAARRLQASQPQVEFVLCGDGPRLRHFRRLARDLHNVHFPGWVDHPEITVLMQWSDLGLAAYARGAPQSLPNKPIEYLAGGLPVCSSLAGELHDYLSTYGCGMAYTPADDTSLAASLDRLARDRPRVQAMKSAARRLFQSHFAARHVYPKMIALLENVANTTPAVAPAGVGAREPLRESA